MILNKKYIIGVTFLFCVLSINAQILRQLNAQIQISIPPTLTTSGVINDLTFTFTDLNGKFSADMVKLGDVIIDEYGNSFEIAVNSPTTSGADVYVTVKCLDGVDAQTGFGVIYRPTNKGFALIGVDLNPKVLATTVNMALLTIDGKTANYNSGSSLPPSGGYVTGDVIVNSLTGEMYKLLSTGWTQVDLTALRYSYASPATAEPPGVLGDIVVNAIDGLYYYFNGTSWVTTLSVTSLPVLYKFGDVFFVTGENKLYMFGADGVWAPISGASVPTGPIPPTTPKAGDFFFNNVSNILYVYDALGRWVEVSINGSIPTGTMNPDPAVVTVKEGELFYNTTDHKLYNFNGTTWVSLINSLTNGQIFIGNSSNVPVSVPLSGDATISTTGKLTISNSAVTNSKLDKANIPLDGFGLPLNNVYMGDGTVNYQIKHLANPILSDDAATKSYIDMLFAAPSTLGLLNGYVFVGGASNKAVAVAKSTVSLSDFGKATAVISMGTAGGPYFNINNMANPASPQDAATKYYVDNRMVTSSNITLANNQLLVGTPGGVATATAKSTLPFSDFGAATSDVLMGGKSLKNLHDPTSAQDAATKAYVDSKTLTLTSNYVFQGDATNTPVSVAKNAIPLSDWGAAISNVSMGGTNLTDLADPRLTAAGLQDAATRNYVDKKMGSTTTGTTPPSSPTIGTTYYNTTDKILYVFDGSSWIPVNNVLPNGQFYIGDASNKAVPIVKSAITLSGFGDAQANVSMGTGSNNYKIINLADPAGDQDASTKKYVDSKAGTSPSGPTPPTTPTVGSTYYNTIDKTLYVYDGTQWTPVGNNTLPNGDFYIGDASNKAIPIVKSAITLSGFGDAQANISMGTGSNNYKIINVADPAGDQDAATKKYVDGKTGTVTTGTTPPASPTTGTTYYNTTDKTFYVYDGSQWLPVNNILPTGQLYVGDASNKAAATAKNTIPLSGFAAAAADIDLGTHKINNVVDPIANQDAATKKYVDGKAGSVTTGTTPPPSPTTGTTYYNTTDKTFYVYDGTGWVPVNNILPNGDFYVGDATNKAVPIVKSAITLSGFGDAQANISMGTGSNNYKIINVADPAGDQDAATKKYVDGKTGSVTTGTNPPLSPTTGTTYYNTTDKTFYVYDGTSWLPVNNILPTGQLYVGDATNKAVATAKNTIPLSGFAAAVADIDLGTHKIANVVDPVANQDAATKKYVDGKTGSVITGTTPPPSPSVGTTYYNTTDKIFYVYDGTSWLPVNNILPSGEFYVGDASNKAVPVAKSAITLSGFGDAQANISMGTGSNNYKIINVADPAGDQDAATKKYVDGKTGGVTTGTTPPTGPTTGSTYYNTTDKILYVYDGTVWIPAVPGDNLGNHTATQNIKTATYAISNDGLNGKGLTFETAGNAIFAQDVTVQGNFYTPSDKRLKTNIETLGSALQAIDSMRGVRFEYKDQKKYAKGPKIGVIAQELMKVYPEMVTKGPDGFFKVDYTQLTGVLIQAVKEQQQKMKQQQLEIDELKVRLDNQQLQINAILKKLN